VTSLLSRIWFRTKFLLLAVAITLFGLLLPGAWLAGVPLGVGLSALLLRHVAGQSDAQPLPANMVSAVACYALSLVPGMLALFVGAHIAAAVGDKPGYEVTVLGVALGFFLYPTYKLLRWGRSFQMASQRAV
jgi:hypothetical protein